MFGLKLISMVGSGTNALTLEYQSIKPEPKWLLAPVGAEPKNPRKGGKFAHFLHLPGVGEGRVRRKCFFARGY